MNKPKVLKDYNKLDKSILSMIKLNYPFGFKSKIITFKSPKGEIVSALPFETEKFYYLIKMTEFQAKGIIEDDDDYENGQLKDEAKTELELQLKKEIEQEMNPSEEE